MIKLIAKTRREKRELPRPLGCEWLARVELNMADGQDRLFKLDKSITILSKLQDQVEELRSNLALCLKTMGSGSLEAKETHKVCRPNPKMFNGSRNAQELGNFLRKMEKYFEGISLTDEKAKVYTSICTSQIQQHFGSVGNMPMPNREVA
ncbi:hypothetical protein AMTR_s00026p00101610 [Amborella trichopoda]|uniref:Uncharacterized protein n=1 Tax=Amborella trichopoda TaxID=13333 RepID=W1PK49_AMBTC|nr:hypothetical protein AMTR_s00026p00101610 [Amborella trichopoda]